MADGDYERRGGREAELKRLEAILRRRARGGRSDGERPAEGAK